MPISPIHPRKAFRADREARADVSRIARSGREMTPPDLDVSSDDLYAGWLSSQPDDIKGALVERHFARCEEASEAPERANAIAVSARVDAAVIHSGAGLEGLQNLPLWAN